MRSRRLQGAKRSKAPRQRWHSWHSWRCGLCNLQNLKGGRETESPLSPPIPPLCYQYFRETRWFQGVTRRAVSSLGRNSFANNRERKGLYTPKDNRGLVRCGRSVDARTLVRATHPSIVGSIALAACRCVITVKIPTDFPVPSLTRRSDWISAAGPQRCTCYS